MIKSKFMMAPEPPQEIAGIRIHGLAPQTSLFIPEWMKPVTLRMEPPKPSSKFIRDCLGDRAKV